jgi:hypothetical protein
MKASGNSIVRLHTMSFPHCVERLVRLFAAYLGGLTSIVRLEGSNSFSRTKASFDSSADVLLLSGSLYTESLV